MPKSCLSCGKAEGSFAEGATWAAFKQPLGVWAYVCMLLMAWLSACTVDYSDTMAQQSIECQGYDTLKGCQCEYKTQIQNKFRQLRLLQHACLDASEMSYHGSRLALRTHLTRQYRLPYLLSLSCYKSFDRWHIKIKAKKVWLAGLPWTIVVVQHWDCPRRH